MRAEPVVGVQPSVIRWARESMGMSVEDVAHKLKRSAEEVMAWESEDGTPPTYSQLENLAYKVFKRPLAVFFLPAAPDEVPPAREFRTLPDADLQSLQADTYVQVRKAHAYQITLKELFEGRNPSGRHISQEIPLDLRESVEVQARAVRKTLGISLDDQLGWKSDDLALKRWREALEALGVFVFKAPFKQKDISGFCLLDADFPLIYLNNSATKTRQIFSLLHELAHLLLNINGISKFESSYINRLPATERRIEQFCNKIAAEILIPSDDFAQQIAGFPSNAESVQDYLYANLASRYGASREAVLRRLLDMERVSQSFYEQKAKLWSSQKKAASGGDWYASQNTYLSDRLAREVIGRHYRNQISVEQASEFLGIKAKNFAGLEQRILQGAAA
ncbi:MAG: DNA-binding protein [Burkholderiales bacterium RIFCSPHIGHO2_12_FULL_61_11]|nr:MAG: DNA-binding protein [Burkholderiales bacterium RIFCSPHIGHO2_12_FULL_61_11]